MIKEKMEMKKKIIQLDNYKKQNSKYLNKYKKEINE